MVFLRADTEIDRHRDRQTSIETSRHIHSQPRHSVCRGIMSSEGKGGGVEQFRLKVVSAGLVCIEREEEEEGVHR